MAHWVLDPLGADEQRCCAAGAPGLAPWVPDPLRALVAPQGWGKIGLRGRGVVGAPFPDPPPFLGSRDGALKKVIDGGK